MIVMHQQRKPHWLTECSLHRLFSTIRLLWCITLKINKKTRRAHTHQSLFLHCFCRLYEYISNEKFCWVKQKNNIIMLLCLSWKTNALIVCYYARRDEYWCWTWVCVPQTSILLSIGKCESVNNRHNSIRDRMENSGVGENSHICDFIEIGSGCWLIVAWTGKKTWKI